MTLGLNFYSEFYISVLQAIFYGLMWFYSTSSHHKLFVGDAAGKASSRVAKLYVHAWTHHDTCLFYVFQICSSVVIFLINFD
jgi:hypothetical protein